MNFNLGGITYPIAALVIIGSAIKIVDQMNFDGTGEYSPYLRKVDDKLERCFNVPAPGASDLDLLSAGCGAIRRAIGVTPVTPFYDEPIVEERTNEPQVDRQGVAPRDMPCDPMVVDPTAPRRPRPPLQEVPPGGIVIPRDQVPLDLMDDIR